MLDLPCPLLEKGKCIAYGARPFSCRTLYARTDPKSCHPHRMQNAMFVDRTEIIPKFRTAEGHILARHKLSLIGMPVSKAVLLGEKIATGENDIENFLAVAVESLKEEAAT